MSAPSLLIATSNSGKVHEMTALLREADRKLLFLSDLPSVPSEPEETGQTFAENSQLKARYYSHLSQLPTIADDSGLSVLGLDGFPGVQSARWVEGKDIDRVTALLALLDKNNLTEPIQRRAYFTCVVSFALPNSETTTEFEGICWGTLTHVPIGTSGFGYDSIFMPDGASGTLAQLGFEEKNQLSARSVAMKKFSAWLATH